MDSDIDLSRVCEKVREADIYVVSAAKNLLVDTSTSELEAMPANNERENHFKVTIKSSDVVITF